MLSILLEHFEALPFAQRCLLAATVPPLLALAVYEYMRWRVRLRDFHGPSGLPILGNLWQIQHGNAPWLYQQWSKEYGPVYQVQAGNIPMLLLNSAAAAKQILTANSHATASRPEFYTFHRIVSNHSATTVGTSAYSPSLKKRRKTLATALNKPAVASYLPLINHETQVFLKEALEYGHSGKADVDPSPLFLRMAISLGFTLHWGRSMDKQSDMFREITEVEEAISNFRSMTGNAQDYVPLLRLLPFNPVSALAKQMGSRRSRYTEKLDHDLDVEMAQKTHKACIRANAKMDPEETLDALELTSLNATITAAGLDTVQATVLWAIAVLCMKPDMQNQVLGAIRVKYPETDDVRSASDDEPIEYLNIFIKEVLRCYPATRLSLPRETIQDFNYDGKLIPRGTILVLNAWACNNDPEIWSDADQFRPERWLENPEAPSFTFGLGSRMCIGSHLATRELYLLFLRVIHFFMLKTDDVIDLDPITGVANTATTVSSPKPFKVKLVPRNLEALERLLASEGEKQG